MEFKLSHISQGDKGFIVRETLKNRLFISVTNHDGGGRRAAERLGLQLGLISTS